ncbi:MAG TPA: PLxRFG domain-containing protein, partial [Burkholderiaceae bacterium]|nr:PLxRFG domain-containing protein [Burkholderiaceae bacterium]
KSTRSAMKRLIERKGIAGFSEDAGRVLAGFVYSNARQTSQNLHTGEMVQAANDIPKGMGELKDKATQLVEYIKHPQEEAQKVRGLLFAQYIGGSVASAMVNMTQPFTMTMPWLSQFGGIAKSAKQMTAAVKDATKKTTGDAALDAALKRGEEDGTVSPQEVHDLMRQAQGKGALKSGDGTKMGNAAATAQNVVSRIGFAWGKLFSTAEQFNRRVTFIAAYRTAVEQGMSNPDAFARRAIHETQGVYNKGNKPDWARGAVGSTLFTFKQYSIAYVEMLHRMATTGEPGSPERAAGRRGALYALAVLMLLSGVGGLPGADDLDDIISGLMQSLGYNFDSKAKRKAFLAEYLGDGAAQFMERGVSGIAGVPIDISGRMGLGNLIPATGLLTKKTDHTSDVAELLGPAGDLAKRAFQAGGKLIEGDVLGSHGAVATASPKAIQNLFQAADMADKGMYRDQTGKKVMETGPGDALSKALGFQPNDVKRQQDATWEVKRMVDLNRITETSIADRWAIGLFEKDAGKIQEARDDLAKWNSDNPESPIRIKFPQILQRVRAMNQTKTERIAKTAPKELRAQVREALSQQ